MKRFLHITAICFILISSTVFNSIAKQENRKYPYRYLIPYGYTGWVRVDFNVRDTPSLPVQDGYYIIKIPVSGHLQTSTSDDYGISGDDYYYYCGDMKKRIDINTAHKTCKIWGRVQGPVADYNRSGGPSTWRFFFVGLREDFIKYEHTGNNPLLEVDQDGLPKPGYFSILPCPNKPGS